MLILIKGAETTTEDGAMGVTQSSYVTSFSLAFGIVITLASDETNDFTLQGFLETNLLRPVKMMWVLSSYLFVRPMIKNAEFTSRWSYALPCASFEYILQNLFSMSCCTQI
jgi:hypothetical protein